MIDFTQPIFIILISSGVCIWLIGLYVLRNPPKSINRIYGYRTPRAMRSQEAWDYAQIHGTKKMIAGAQFMCAIAVFGLFFKTSELGGTFIALFLLFIGLLFPLWQTEMELKNKFESKK